MLRGIGKTDKILMLLALVSLIFSEAMWFNGEKDGALFVGLWVPSILALGTYVLAWRNEK